ncbi:MAG TPA: NTP transferase domain-containing protein [Planctomycetaceae bacterium]|nr:NTP transferase domain-containing protein [Planctomycetaceae bacterium]
MAEPIGDVSRADPALAIILAAGKSTRMKSALPKVVHEVCGRPMVEYVIDAVRDARVRRIVLVVGHGAETVRDLFSGQPGIEFALQAEQRGTGHAVMMCREHLAGVIGPVFVLNGDIPLVKSQSLSGLLHDLLESRAACAIGSAVTDANEGLGRIVRDSQGAFVRIVEHKDATPAELAIREINTGSYAFDGPALLWSLDQIRPNNVQQEYYLTDCPAALKQAGRTVVASPRFDFREAMGVNTRAQLADVERSIQRDTQQALMAEGVTIVAPEMTYIDPRARIGAETIIYPFTTITGSPVIGRNCRIGPHALVHGSVQVPDNTIIPAFGAVS